MQPRNVARYPLSLINSKRVDIGGIARIAVLVRISEGLSVCAYALIDGRPFVLRTAKTVFWSSRGGSDQSEFALEGNPHWRILAAASWLSDTRCR